jgi:hypothetical protein
VHDPCPTGQASHHALRRRWGDWAPAAGALLHIRIVPWGIVAIVPGGRSRLDIDLRGWGDDDRRGRIRRPVRVPVRPDGHPKTRTDKAMAAMPKVVPPMATVPTTPRVPWHRARHEQCHQQREQHSPLLPRARGASQFPCSSPRMLALGEARFSPPIPCTYSPSAGLSRHTLSAQRHFPDALSERTGEHGMTAGIFSSSLHYPRCISALLTSACGNTLCH